MFDRIGNSLVLDFKVFRFVHLNHNLDAVLRIELSWSWWFTSLWFLFKPRINLSPFTKDFRGEEQHNESID